MPPTAPVEEASGEESTRASAPWSVVGTWDCSHPAWSGAITIFADGTFARAQGDAGRWTLAGLQDQVMLVLAWDHWSAETAVMMGPDEFRGEIRTQSTRGELEMRRRVRPTVGDGMEEAPKPVPDEAVDILAASYSFGSQYVDVTKRVRDLLRAGKSFQANPPCLLADPKPGWNKALVIFCKVRGKRAIFSVGEGEEISRELLLKNARTLDERTASEKPGSAPN